MSAAVISRVPLAIFGPHDKDLQPKHEPTDSPADAASTEPDFARFAAQQPTPISERQPAGPRQPGGPCPPFTQRRDSSKPPNRAALSSSFPNHPPSSSPAPVAPLPTIFNPGDADANQVGQRQPGGPTGFNNPDSELCFRILPLTPPIPTPPPPPSKPPPPPPAASIPTLSSIFAAGANQVGHHQPSGPSLFDLADSSMRFRIFDSTPPIPLPSPPSSNSPSPPPSNGSPPPPPARLLRY